MQRLTAYAEALAPVARCMLEQARISAGQRVLDIGSGGGDMALLAAEVVGPSGFVLASDVSLERMTGLAARVSFLAPPPPIALHESPAEELSLEPGSFDVALARNCVMYFQDLGRALGNVRRALRPGGRLVISVYGPMEREPFHAIPVAAVTGRQSPPDPAPDYVQAFRVGAPDVRTALLKAEFTGVRTQVVSVCRSYPDLAFALETMRRSASLAELMSMVSEPDREDAWAEIARGFGHYDVPDGVRIPGEQVVIVGTA
jgi:ubiquinone/menaquinone biosynthesis C-methylase UbiE